jgi:hypothetical protein
MATLWDFIQICESPFEASWKFSRPCNIKLSLKPKKGDHELAEKMETRSNAFQFLWDVYIVLHYYSADEWSDSDMFNMDA